MKEMKNSPRPRKMTKGDLTQAVDLHTVCIPDHFSTGLGKHILHYLYAQAVDDPKSMATVLEVPSRGRIAGIAVGTLDPKFEMRLMCYHPFGFLWGTLRGLFISPAVRQGIWMRLHLIKKMFRRRVDHAMEKTDIAPSKGPEARFLYVAVYPEYRGGRNSERLVDYFAKCIFQIGAARLRGVVYPKNLATLILYKRLGWNVKKTGPSRVDVWLDFKETNS